MKTIVITGSTRGIGFGLANAFLERDCQVVISGRSQRSVDAAVAKLSAEYPDDRMHGCPCDVADAAQIAALWRSAADHFGRIDIWINNAGIGHPMLPVWEVDPAQADAIIDVNIKGVLNGSRIAIQGMLKQGGGFLYNMEGFGSNGRTRDGISVYGMSKAAVTFLTKSLSSEVSNTPVKVGRLSPGIVITEFITDQYADDPDGLESAKRIFNILGDRVETVTPWLADNVLANDKNGAAIEWLTRVKITKRFLTANFNKRDLFAEPAR